MKQKYDVKSTQIEFEKQFEGNATGPTLRKTLQYADPRTKLWLAGGLVAILLNGLALPACNVLLGRAVSRFSNFEADIKHYNMNRNVNHTNNNTVDWDAGKDVLKDRFQKDVWWILADMLLMCVQHYAGTCLSLFCFNRFAARLLRNIRWHYFRSVLMQDIAWIDTKKSGEFTQEVISCFKKLEGGINENLSQLLYLGLSGICNCALGIIYGWKLALVLLATVPCMIAASYFISKFQRIYHYKASEANTQSMSTFEEIFSGFRTVVTYNGQQKEIDRYERSLRPATKHACNCHFVSSLTIASNWGQLYLAMAAGLYVGVRLMETDKYDIGDFITVFWAIMSFGYGLSLAAPYFESLQGALNTTPKLFAVIDHERSIANEKSKKTEEAPKTLWPWNFEASIEFRNVEFTYPLRPRALVLPGVSFHIKAGETVAFVGPSGSGKSTIVQLVQRFYDPTAGSILLGGVDLRVMWICDLRPKLGVVGQDPKLFDGTIELNIRLGLPNDQVDTAKFEVIERAARLANAHDFISKLPDGYNTLVGEGGALLSGGQKQRISIARSLVGDPKVLLLDEATSALDMKSEKIVQKALEQASKGRTTLIVAHRLSTVRQADRIFYLQKGQILEVGNHDELMEKRGAYYKLVMAQQVEDIESSDGSYNEDDDGTPPPGTNKLRALTLSIRSRSQSQVSEKLEPMSSPPRTDFIYKRLIQEIRPDVWLLMLAIFSSLFYGTITPLFSIIFGSYADLFAEVDAFDERKRRTNIYVFEFFGLVALSLVTSIGQTTFFGMVNERLVERLRLKSFRSLIHQEMAFFDDDRHATSMLVAKLSEMSSSIQEATGTRLGLLVQVISACTFAVGVAFFYNWRLALFGTILLPLIVVATITSSHMTSRMNKGKNEAATNLGRLLMQVVESKRTIDSLHKHDYFFAKFEKIIMESYENSSHRLSLRVLLLGFAISASYYFYATMFTMGGWLVKEEMSKVGDCFRVIESLLFASQVIGNAVLLTVDLDKAKLGVQYFFELIDRKSNRNFGCDLRLVPSRPICGEITVNKLRFAYPLRPEAVILDGLSFKVPQGKTVALVGESGCGKSTVLQLIEQFYKPSGGQILIDGQAINTFDIEWLRSQITHVSQDSALFSYSIRDNIAYGDNSREHIPFDEIVRVARMANAHDFIQTLPNGYDTTVGPRGSQLSGGQRQRISIARALLRDSKILLLDEPTSALDSESEAAIQEALDKALQDRTCIVIAHRLKTVVNADKIVVMQRGRNIEEGTHQALVDAKGFYCKLYNHGQDIA